MYKWKDAWPTYITALPIVVIACALIGRAISHL